MRFADPCERNSPKVIVQAQFREFGSETFQVRIWHHSHPPECLRGGRYREESGSLAGPRGCTP